MIKTPSDNDSFFKSFKSVDGQALINTLKFSQENDKNDSNSNSNNYNSIKEVTEDLEFTSGEKSKSNIFNLAQNQIFQNNNYSNQNSSNLDSIFKKVKIEEKLNKKNQNLIHKEPSNNSELSGLAINKDSSSYIENDEKLSFVSKNSQLSHVSIVSIEAKPTSQTNSIISHGSGEVNFTYDVNDTTNDDQT